MPISNFQPVPLGMPIAERPEGEKQPFAEREKRTLTLRAERIDPKYLTPLDGLPPHVEAEYKRAEKHPTHEARFFQLEIRNPQSAIRIQLNHGDPADDEARLAAIAEDLLTESPGDDKAPSTAGGSSPAGGPSPRDAGGL